MVGMTPRSLVNGRNHVIQPKRKILSYQQSHFTLPGVGQSIFAQSNTKRALSGSARLALPIATTAASNRLPHSN